MSNQNGEFKNDGYGLGYLAACVASTIHSQVELAKDIWDMPGEFLKAATDIDIRLFHRD